MKRLVICLSLCLSLVLISGVSVEATETCDNLIQGKVYKTSTDKLVVCDGGIIDIRGLPAKASVSVDTSNPSSTDTAVLTVDVLEDDSEALETNAVVDVFISDTSAGGTTAARPLQAPNGGTASSGLFQSGSDSGTIFVEHVTDAYAVMQTNGKGQLKFSINDSTDTNRWVNIVTPNGDIKESVQIDFD